MDLFDDRGLAITPPKKQSQIKSTPVNARPANQRSAPARSPFGKVWDAGVNAVANRFYGISPLKNTVPITDKRLTEIELAEKAARDVRVQAIMDKYPYERNVGPADKTLAIGLLGGAAAIAANNSALGQIIRPYAGGLYNGVSYLSDLGINAASKAIGYGATIAKVATTDIPIPVNLAATAATTAPSPINIVASAAAPVAQQTASAISSLIGPANWALLAAAGVLAIGGGYYLYNWRYGKKQVKDATAKMIKAVNQIERTSVAALERISAKQDVSPQVANTAIDQSVIIIDAAEEAKAAIRKALTTQSGADLNRAEQRVLELAIASSQPLRAPATSNVSLLPAPIIPAGRRASLQPETFMQKRPRSPVGKRNVGAKTPAARRRRASSPSSTTKRSPSPNTLKRRSPSRTSPKSPTKPKSPPRRRAK